MRLLSFCIPSPATAITPAARSFVPAPELQLGPLQPAPLKKV